jgi:pimeloyl-ACP methyl ester carboxylesterase
VAVGFTLGGDAALLATIEDKRIDRVVAIDPYLTTKRMQDILRKRHDAYWFPFYRTIMWWWYDMRSSYAASYRDYDDIKAVACPTLLFISEEVSDDREVQRLAELSDPALLELKTTLPDDDRLFAEILSFMGLGE